jgi:anti-sigma B factor antagonist
MDELDEQQETVGSAEVGYDPAGLPVIRLSGEVDMSNVDALRAKIQPAIDKTPSSVVFDMAGLTFMDSSGIALLLQVAAATKTVQLRDASPLVRRIVEATGLTEILRIEP